MFPGQFFHQQIPQIVYRAGEVIKFDNGGKIIRTERKGERKNEKIFSRKYMYRTTTDVLILSFLFSILYFNSTSQTSHPFLRSFIKWSSISLLVYIVMRYRKTQQDIFLAMALIFHSIGDVVLCFSLLPSLGAFFLGHLFYCLAFCCDVPFPTTRSSGRNSSSFVPSSRKLLILTSILYCVSFGTMLVKAIPSDLTLPVVLYISIIMIMTVVSLIPTYERKLINIGVVFYLVSDSLIALNRFPIFAPIYINGFNVITLMDDYLAWPLYYIGQILITLGILYESGKFQNIVRPPPLLIFQPDD